MVRQRDTDRKPTVTPEEVGQDPEERVYRRSGFVEGVKSWLGIWMAVVVVFLVGLIAVLVWSNVY